MLLNSLQPYSFCIFFSVFSFPIWFYAKRHSLPPALWRARPHAHLKLFSSLIRYAC